MNDVEKHIDNKSMDIEKSRANILKYEKEISELERERKDLAQEKDMYSGELKKFTTYADPSGPSLE